jgi:acetyl esterase/lipase
MAMTLFPVIVFARVAREERDKSESGAMTLEQLRQEPITFELDIPYAETGNPRHRLDLYLPKNPRGHRLPVIVYIHGGGWMQGNKSDGAGWLMPFLRPGNYAGVSIGYRLSDEATWPAQIHDCKAAIRWVRANAAKYGLNADRIGVWGRSAGGHLVLMLGASGDVPKLEGDLGPYKIVSSKVAAVANFFGVTELLALIGQPSNIDRTKPDAPEALLIGGPLPENPQKAKSSSPMTYVTPNDPPVLTVHGTADHTVPYDQAVRLDAALRKVGVRSYFVTVKGAGHGNFGTAADDRVREFFGKYLRGMNVHISTATIKDWKH